MRIISGTAGGLTIEVPKAVTRPTTDKVRQAIFSMLGEVVVGARVLDLFAGSGAMGLEALSRGAESALFVDENRGACEVVRKNLAKARLEGGKVRGGDALRVLAELSKTEASSVDLVFADPPYQHERGAKNWAQELLDSEGLHGVIKADGSVVIECSASTHLLLAPERWTVIREREYGGTKVLWIGRRTADEVG